MRRRRNAGGKLQARAHRDWHRATAAVLRRARLLVQRLLLQCAGKLRLRLGERRVRASTTAQLRAYRRQRGRTLELRRVLATARRVQVRRRRALPATAPYQLVLRRALRPNVAVQRHHAQVHGGRGNYSPQLLRRQHSAARVPTRPQRPRAQPARLRRNRNVLARTRLLLAAFGREGLHRD